MAVVALYFVDYLKGKMETHIPFFPRGFPSPVTLQRHPTRSPFNLPRFLPSAAAGGDLNRSAAARAALHREATAQEE